MRIGDLNRSLTFQAPSGTPVVWTTIFTCKGALWSLSGAEAVAALSLGGSITGKVRIRYRPVKILITWRILVENSILGIASPPMRVGGRNEYFEIRIKEIF